MNWRQRVYNLTGSVIRSAGPHPVLRKSLPAPAFSVPLLARAAGVPARAIRRDIRRGVLRALKVGSRWRVHAREADRWAAGLVTSGALGQHGDSGRSIHAE